MDCTSAPKIVAVASRSRLDALSDFFSRRKESVSWMGTTSVSRLESLLQDTPPEILIIDASFSRPFQRWKSLFTSVNLVLVVSDDPELDWVELGAPSSDGGVIRIVRPEGLFLAITSRLGEAPAKSIATESGRHRLEVPAISRGVAPINPSANPRAKTARLQLRDGFYDLSRSSLRVVAARVASDRRTGVLKIKNGKETAELHFLMGQPQRALHAGMDGVAALVRFVHWDKGYATWSDDAVSLAASLDPDTAKFLMGILPSAALA